MSDRFGAGADSTSCIAEEGSIYPTSLSAMEDDFDAGADDRTALQKLMYPDQEELPDNFEVSWAGGLCSLGLKAETLWCDPHLSHGLPHAMHAISIPRD